MEIPQGLKYSKEHEWVATEDSVATIGISDHAQDQLGEIVYIELPAVGDKISKDDPLPPDSELPKVRLVFSRVVGSLENHSNQVGQDDWKLLAKYAGGLDG